jgi:hypothetical protein
VFKSKFFEIALLLLSTAVAGCAATPPNPAASIHHPANPDAAEAPIPTQSTTLMPGAEGTHP